MRRLPWIALAKRARRRLLRCLGHATVTNRQGECPISAIRRHIRSLTFAAIVDAGQTADTKSSVIPEQQSNIAERTHVQTSEQKQLVMQSTNNEAADRILSELDGLAPIIAARAAEAEEARRIPADIIQMLKSVGLFRMTAPQIHGGLEFDFPIVARILQRLFKIDGSTGWVVTITNATALLLPLLPRETYEETYRNGPDRLCAGGGQPTGTAVAEAGGLRVNGRWPFASGCEDADWIAGICVLTQDGKPAPGPAEGVPAVRVVCLPARYWQIEDTWYAPGLRATGSHHIVLKDVFVPSENIFDMASARPCLPGPLYSAPPMQIAALLHGPIALGMAEGAIDDLVAIAQSGRKQQHAAVSMRDSEIFHYELGRAQAEFRAAQVMCDAQIAGHWRHALAGTLSGDALHAEATQSMIWVTEGCLRVIQSCFALAGGAAVFNTSPLQRRLRDMQTAAQHLGVHARHYAQAGKLLLSLKNEPLQQVGSSPGDLPHAKS
jgi:indole-3-acetate monooxygenase